MIRPTEEHGDVDLVPQAVLQYPLSTLAQRYRILEGFDDLDYYGGASFMPDDQWPLLFGTIGATPKEQ